MGFLEQVIEYRRYAEACAANEADPKNAVSSPLRAIAQELEFELVREEIDRRG